MKVTINDVAKYAGVSIKTVSRVTNNEPSVKQATIDKVNAAIKALNYQPNLAARNLAATSSYVIGFVYDNPNAYYIIDMQNGILSACRDKGYELLIHPCDAKADGICEQLTTMVKHARLAGLVLTPPLSEDPKVLSALDAIGANYVRIMAGDRVKADTGLAVLVNDRSGAVAITQHLIDLGHRQIAFLSGDYHHQSTKERLEGYRQALRDNDLDESPELIVEGEYSFESGVEGAKKLLKGANRPSAIVACNDEIAAGACLPPGWKGWIFPPSSRLSALRTVPSHAKPGPS